MTAKVIGEMGKTFERIEKHLYKRQYRTARGDWSVNFYARFTDFNGKRRIFPLGSDLKTAREELKVLEGTKHQERGFWPRQGHGRKGRGYDLGHMGRDVSFPARRQK